MAAPHGDLDVLEKTQAEKEGHDLALHPKDHLQIIEENAVAFDAYAHTSIPREDVSFEERIWYANQQRRSYGMHNSSKAKRSFTDKWFGFFDNSIGPDVPENELVATPQPLEQFDYDTNMRTDRWSNIQADAARAKKAVRLASWTAAFYLMTTDALGPFNAPFAISQLGWAPGLMTYITFGIATFYSSWLITNLFLRFDSDRHPVRTYADLMYVFFGRVGFWITVFCQLMGLYISGAANILGTTQGIYELDNGDFCFIATLALIALAAFTISVPLRKIGWLAWIAGAGVYLNLLILFLSMGFLAHSEPDFAAAQAAYGTTVIPGPPYLPVTTQSVVDGLPLATRVNGVSNAIYAWGALQLFVEFMAEMRRPQQFWRSFCGGELLCLTVYLVYGSYTYYYQGQYTQGLSYQGIGNYTYQEVCNIISVFTQVFACVLYVHIAMKVLWQTVAEDIFGWPSVQVGVRGWALWFALNCAIYPLVFVVAAAIPQLFTISALFAALFILQFSFTFPPLMQLAFDVVADASKKDELFVLGEEPRRYDAWTSPARWTRGLFTGRIFVKSFNLIYVLAGFGLCGLGAWGSIEEIKITFAAGAGTSFGCTPFI